MIWIENQSEALNDSLIFQVKSISYFIKMKVFGRCYERFSPYDKYVVKYGVDNYIGALGLAVNRKYRGIGLGERLLATR